MYEKICAEELRPDLKVRRLEVDRHAAAVQKYMENKSDREAALRQVKAIQEAHALAVQQWKDAGGEASGGPEPAMQEPPAVPTAPAEPGDAPESSDDLKKEREIKMVFITEMMPAET